MSSLNFSDTPTQPLSDQARTFGLAEALSSSAEHPCGYSCLKVDGADAASFLQGQLTADVAGLAIGQCRTAALCNPKGRVIAQIETGRISQDTFALILAHSLVTQVIGTLTRYILRSKVTIAAWPDQAMITMRQTDTPVDSGACRLEDDGTLNCRARWLPANEPSWVLTTATLDGDSAQEGDLSWAHAHVMLGIAPPVEATEPQHIPQMLNLDALHAISMTKGCYTGQEIIARVHHRGAVKRRLRRFVTAISESIVPGSTVENEAGVSVGMVLETARDAHDQLGVLAVVKESDFSAQARLTCNDQSLTHWALPYRV